ncbi:MAG TPA: glucose-6-phosphate dehydrogenase [Acidobacteriaceae bacterium]|jgi:glucose-6-phosphate 1-dehydrogenase|nr:glucose-6-phosphate dehydrogenase [Acidobacteriaceae bacterium]
MATTEIRVSPEDVKQAASQVQERIPEPSVAVIFGASGDLTKRKLLPALFHLEQAGLLPEHFRIVGVARRDLGKAFAEDMRQGILEFGGVEKNADKLDEFIGKIGYHAMDFDNDQGYDALKTLLAQYDHDYGTRGNRLFYLATAPDYFADIVHRLGAHGMARPDVGTTRIVIEKPFGHDLESARELNDDVNTVFSENQVFRIDHYLGKETVQNVLVFRFANGIFEPIWNRNYVDHVQITAAESIGIEGRGPFYEKAGALRDVVQNHMMELLSFVTMEPLASFAADAVRREKIKLWNSIKPINIYDCVRGQYGPGIVGDQMVKGYREEDRVDPNSQTETYAALRLEIDNWRWAGVPFYLRAGKRLANRATEITIQFKQPPMLLFGAHMNGPCTEIQPNLLTMRIQPDEGISLRFGAKVPGPQMAVCPVVMDFSYAHAFGSSSANGYERLLLDAMLGDATLFAHRDGVEATWALFTPVLDAWAKKYPQTFPNYAAGTWGPECGDELIGRDGQQWRAVQPPANENQERAKPVSA